MGNVKFTGIMTALVSPMGEDGSIREAETRRLMNWHMGEGVRGFYICGGTGEGVVMQVKHRMHLAEVARDASGGRAKVIAHVGAVDLKSAVELARHAGRIGLDGVSSVPPFFYDYGEKEIGQYYRAISEAAGLPLIMYASPLSGVNITWQMVETLMDIPGMIGVKWTNYDYFTMRRIKELRGGDINVLNGPDECLLCGLAMGADGGIGATYNVMPKVITQIYEGFRDGDIEAAQQAQFLANRLIAVLLKLDVVPSVKAVLRMLGYDCGYCTYPMKRLDDDEMKTLRRELDALDYENRYL